MSILLAAGAALGWGASDYFGGDVSRRQAPVFVILASAQLIGVLLLLPILVLQATPPPADPRLLFAALAGVAVTAELSLIYRALGSGQAFITAPTGALGAAAAVTFGLASGNPLNLPVAIGLACALLGGAISAWPPRTRHQSRPHLTWKTAGTPIGAAAAIATMLISLHAAGKLDPVWATATEHASTALSAAIAATLGRAHSRDRVLPPRQVPRLVLIAAVGVFGDLAYTAASHHGTVSIVAAISSLYPLATIALGVILQHQRPTRTQAAGSLLALLGTALLGTATR